METIMFSITLYKLYMYFLGVDQFGRSMKSFQNVNINDFGQECGWWFQHVSTIGFCLGVEMMPIQAAANNLP